MTERLEPLGGGLSVFVTDACRVTEDAFHLAKFAAPAPTDTVCDLGTGSGILPLLWCRRNPPTHITAVEREAAFATLAQKAVDTFSLSVRITVVTADWNNAPLDSGTFSLVTCNPPYFPFGAARQNPDPLVAAARHEDSDTALPDLCRTAARLLTGNGRFCLCHRPAHLPRVLAALEKAGLVPRRLQFVQATDKADAWLFLLEAGHQGELRVLPPLVRQQTGHHTDVYKRLY